MTRDAPIIGRRSAVAGRNPARAPTNEAVKAPGMMSHAASIRSRTPATVVSLVESRILHRRADEQRTVVPRHHITPIAPYHAAKRRAFPRQPQKLTSDGMYRHAVREPGNLDLPGPAARSQHDCRSCQRPAIGFDNQIPALRRNPSDADVFGHVGAMTPGCTCQRAYQLARGHEAVRRHDESAHHARTEVRFFRPNRLIRRADRRGRPGRRAGPRRSRARAYPRR